MVHAAADAGAHDSNAPVSIIKVLATWLPMTAITMSTFTVTLLENITMALLNNYTEPRTTKLSATFRPHKCVPCIRISLPKYNYRKCL